MDNQEPTQKRPDKQTYRQAEKRVVNKLVVWIIGIVATLLVILGLMGYRYVQTALQPVNEGAKKPIAVAIPIGSTTKEIGARLESQHVIKSATVFNYYVKFHNYTNFKAGRYNFSQAQTLDEIIMTLTGGSGTADAIGTILVKEGETIDSIGDAVQKLEKKNKSFTKAKFLDLMKDEKFFKTLQKRYPALLASAASAKGVRYRLEGYLYPATYSVAQGQTLEGVVEAMVEKENSVMSAYFKSIKKQGFTVQEVLTLASLVEREGKTDVDRKKIAGVFLNRLDIDMPLQSDVTVMYALNTHKEHLTNADTAVVSPYNLYKNKGYGPGPFNSPSESSVRAVLAPSDRAANYLYFVANIRTGEILYANSIEQHDANSAQFAKDNGMTAN